MMLWLDSITRVCPGSDDAPAVWGFPQNTSCDTEVNKFTSGLSFNGDMNGGGEKIDIQHSNPFSSVLLAVYFSIWLRCEWLQHTCCQ